MASMLDSAIKEMVAQGFKGRLSKGVLRRTVVTARDDRGNPSSSTVRSYAFDGIRDSFNAAFAAQAGIKETDVRILIIAGSLKVAPTIDDKVFIRGQWFQLRRLVDTDPAGAHFVFAGFEIKAP